jgi:hypothetical protein
LIVHRNLRHRCDRTSPLDGANHPLAEIERHPFSESPFAAIGHTPLEVNHLLADIPRRLRGTHFVAVFMYWPLERTIPLDSNFSHSTNPLPTLLCERVQSLTVQSGAGFNVWSARGFDRSLFGVEG